MRLPLQLGKGRKNYDNHCAEEHRGSDHNIKEAWGVGSSKPYHIAWYTDGKLPGLGQIMGQTGGDITLGDDGNLAIIMSCHAPLGAPCMKTKSLGGAAIVCPKTYAVDVHIKVDGEVKEDGHVICGPAADRGAAIKHAVDKVALSGEEKPLKDLLESGPPTGPKPWATLVSQDFNRSFHVHLPLIFQGNLDDVRRATRAPPSSLMPQVTFACALFPYAGHVRDV